MEKSKKDLNKDFGDINSPKKLIGYEKEMFLEFSKEIVKFKKSKNDIIFKDFDIAKKIANKYANDYFNKIFNEIGRNNYQYIEKIADYLIKKNFEIYHNKISGIKIKDFKKVIHNAIKEYNMWLLSQMNSSVNINAIPIEKILNL